MSTVEKLHEYLLLLQFLRFALESNKTIKAQKLAEMEAKLAADPEYTHAVDQIKITQEEIEKREAEIKDSALEIYNANPDAGKKLAGGNVSIIEKVNVKIFDQKAAYEWAVKDAPQMLILDTAEILKHAKAVKDTIPLNFVAITTETKAQIASEIKLEELEK